jgi:hypothetical protein
MRGFRSSMLAGIGFVVLYVVAVFVAFGNSPNIKSKDSDAVAAAKYVHELSDSGHRSGLLVGSYLMVIAAILLVWFVQGLRAGVASRTGERVVAGLGIVGAAMLAAGAMTNAVVAGSVSFGDEKVPRDGDTIRVVMDLTFPFWFVAFGLVLAGLLVTVALTGAGWPKWLRGLAWVGAVGAVVAVIFLPMALPLLWLLIAAIIGLTGAQRFAAAEPAARV